MKRKSTVLRILDTLKTMYPDAVCSLTYEKDYELLFATRLFRPVYTTPGSIW